MPADAGLWETAAVYLALAVAPLTFIAAGLWFTLRTRSLVRRGYRTEGTVVAVRTAWSSSTDSDGISTSGRVYHPVFAYRDRDGVERTGATVIGSSSWNLPKGTRREILTDPLDPERVRMTGFWLWGFGAIFLGIGLIIGLVCLVTALAL